LKTEKHYLICIIKAAWMRCREMMRLMDSGTCGKNWESLIHAQRSLGFGKIFSRGGNSELCQVVGGQTHFSWSGSTVVKYHFTNFKVTDNHFSAEKLIGKYKISKSRAPSTQFLFGALQIKPC